MDYEHLIALAIALISSTAFSSFITLWFSKRQRKVDVKLTEVNVVTAKIDQADKIVTIATDLLEDVKDERNKLAGDKKDLEELNNKLQDALVKCEDSLKKQKDKTKSLTSPIKPAIKAVKTVLPPAKKVAKKAPTPKKK